jgi:hypothetical protein
MGHILQSDRQIPQDPQQEHAYALESERTYAQARGTLGATVWDPALVRGLVVAVILGYLFLAGLLVAVAASAGTGG